MLGALMLWRLLDLFKKKGRWAEEYQDPLLGEIKEVSK
jgi:hypothetical protein